MQDKLALLQASLRLNIRMSKVMVEAMRFESSRQYIANARRDIDLINKVKNEWNLDTTKTITIGV